MSDKIGKGRVVLKEYFETDKMPTEGNFADLIDSSLNKTDDQIFISPKGEGNTSVRFLGIGSVDPKSPLSIRNRTGENKLIGLESSGGDEEWNISVNPPDGNNGFLIAGTNQPTSSLLLDSDGKVGIGTKKPEESLQVKGKVKAEEFIGTMDWSMLSNLPMTLFVPKGIIVMWSGAIEEIPDDWVLCDGKNGTPNLTDRFIVGAGKSYKIKDKGGSNLVKLTLGQIPSHNHGGSTQNPNVSLNHQHDYQRRAGWNSGENNTKHARAWFRLETATTGNVKGSNPHLTHTHAIRPEGNNQHHENRPPYFTLAFIMKK